MPRAMGFAGFWLDDKVDEIEVGVRIHNNIAYRESHGLFLMVCGALYINNVPAYFGIQTDVGDPLRGGVGKGAIFSRWETRDLDDTRTSVEGWTESAGYEGNFVSVRSKYEWKDGFYVLRVSGAEIDTEGRWFEYWIKDSKGVDTYIGSIRFPLSDGEAKIDRSCYSTIEVYGSRPLRPKDIPYWRVSVHIPKGDGRRAPYHEIWYPDNVGSLKNMEVIFDGIAAHFEVGLDRIRED